MKRTPLRRKTPLKRGKISRKRSGKKRKAISPIQLAWAEGRDRCDNAHEYCWGALGTHHIVHGRTRPEDSRNYLRLCQRCHDRIHRTPTSGQNFAVLKDGQIKIVRLSSLSLANQLWLKARQIADSGCATEEIQTTLAWLSGFGGRYATTPIAPQNVLAS